MKTFASRSLQLLTSGRGCTHKVRKDFRVSMHSVCRHGNGRPSFGQLTIYGHTVMRRDTAGVHLAMRDAIEDLVVPRR